MLVTGTFHGSRLSRNVGFPTADVPGPDASEATTQAVIAAHGMVFMKPVFRGGIDRKSKARLISKVTNLREAPAEKERVYFVEHRNGKVVVKANDVMLEASTPAEHDINSSITDSTQHRPPTMTLTHIGGVDVEEADRSRIGHLPCKAATGDEG